jgi:hypothetical protein
MGGGPAWADNREVMRPSSLPNAVRPLRPQEIARVRDGCGHAFVPPAPAAWGYRYHDLGGETSPFYVRRFREGDTSASLTLRAPIEQTGWGDAEPGAQAIAQVVVTLGARTIAWEALLGERPASRAARHVLEQVLDELVCLDLVPAHECPICR